MCLFVVRCLLCVVWPCVWGLLCKVCFVRVDCCCVLFVSCLIVVCSSVVRRSLIGVCCVLFDVVWCLLFGVRCACLLFVLL